MKSRAWGQAWLVALVLSSYSFGLRAADGVMVGRLAELSGSVHALSHPSSVAPQEASRSTGASSALYEGKYWLERKLALGDAVYLDDVITSREGGRAHIKLEQGYGLVVGPHSKLKLTARLLERGAPPKLGIVELLTGKLRAFIVGKQQAEAGLEFRTRTAIIGIRGTDFVITADHQRTEVGVISGRIALSSALPALRGIEQQVGPGMSAKVMTPPPQLLQEQEPMNAQSAALQAYLPSAPEPLARTQLAGMEELGQGLALPDAGALAQLKEQMERREAPRPAPKVIKRERVEPPLPLPRLLVKLGARRKEVSFSETKQHRYHDLQASQVDLAGHWFMPQWPVSFGLQLSRLWYEPKGFEFESRRVHKAKGKDISLSAAYWQSFARWRLAWQFTLHVSSEIFLDATNYQLMSPGSERKRETLNSPGMQFSVEAYWPQRYNLSPFLSLGVSMQGLQEPGVSAKNDFSGVLLGFGVAWEHHA